MIAIVAVLVGGAAATALLYSRPTQAPQGAVSAPSLVKPTLYCEFYNFMHNAVVVSFDFAVSRGDEAHLSFVQLFVVEPDGTKTDYADNARPWRVGDEDGTPLLTSPDSDTRILLYGLKPKAAGVFWTEAGLRSTSYRNLQGTCRQAHLDKAAIGP